MPSARGRSAGFTLIETLVALAIVGMALGAVAGVFGNGLAAHETAAGAEAALALAEERLALAGVAGLRPGNETGTFAERFAWQTTIAPYEEKDDRDLGLTAAKSLPRLYRIAITVVWRDGHRERRLSLSTLRLGPATP